MSVALDYSQLQPALNLSRELIYKDYLNHLECAPINPVSANIPIETIHFLKITATTCPTSSNFNAFIATLYALWSLDITLCYILQVSPSSTTAYFGVSHKKDSALALEILQQGLISTYSPLSLEIIKETTLCDLLIQQLFKAIAVSSATFIPAIPNATTCTTPLLTPFLESMKGYSYTLVFLATPLNHCIYQCLYQEKLQALYNILFPFKDITYSHHSHNTNICTDGTSCNQTENQTHTQSEAKEANCSSTSSLSTSQSLTLNYDMPIKVKPTQASTSNTAEGHTSNSRNTNTDTCSNQNTHADGATKSHTHTTLDIQSTNYKSQNIKVITLLTQIERLLTRYQNTFNQPIFNFNTYFLAESPATCIQASANYINLLEYKTAPLYPSFINTWFMQNPSFDCLLTSLTQLKSPSFCRSNALSAVIPALPITSLELNALLAPPLISL